MYARIAITALLLALLPALACVEETGGSDPATNNGVNNDAPDDLPNNDFPNNDGNNDNNDLPNNDLPNNNDPTPQVPPACQQACARMSECSEAMCGGQPAVDAAACLEACALDPAGFGAEAINQATCADLNATLCDDPAIAARCECGGPDPCDVACDRINTCGAQICGGAPLERAACLASCQQSPERFNDLPGDDCDELNRRMCLTPEFIQGCNCASVNRCPEACDRILECGREICDQPFFERRACIDACTADPQSFDPVRALTTLCPDLNRSLCEETPELGAACACADLFGVPGDPCQEDDPQSCTGEFLCVDGACSFRNDAGDIRLRVDRIFMPEEVDGECWDFGCNAPDPYVMIEQEGFEGVREVSPVFDDTFEVRPGHVMDFPGFISSGDVYLLTVMDEDFNEDDLAVQCRLEVTAALLRARRGTCEGDGVVLEYSLIY